MCILICEPEAFPQAAIERMARLVPVFRADVDFYDPATVQAVFIRLARYVDAAFLEGFPNLRFLISPTTGLTHIDLAACAERNIEVISLRGEKEFLSRIRATTEFTLGLLLALIRRIPAAAQAVREGQWDRYPFKGREIAGKTVFLWGYGRIGQQMDAVLSALGARVIACDRDGGAQPRVAVTLADGLRQADIVSIHMNYEPRNDRCVDATAFAVMKPGVVFINTARGELVDEAALFAGLRSGHVACAALDVLRDERSATPDSVVAALKEFGPRLLVTPHIGGFTPESLDVVELFVADRLLAAFAS